jgi:L,D-peptidoglycan transpeptidase YkuD (ErfK/YbiS/YcfS/YnhG family)
MANPGRQTQETAAAALGYQAPLRIGSRSRKATRGFATAGVSRLSCALGRNGRSHSKREGDGATPIGIWRPIMVLYRADRIVRPKTRLPVKPLRPDDGWCDAVGDRNYNRPVRHPYPASAERLWRDDDLYDLIVVLDHNARPRVQGAGSAIFIHLARPGYSATEGCIAFARRDLLLLLAQIGRGTRLWVV